MEKDVKKRAVAVAALSATLSMFEEMDKERERRIDKLERRVSELEKLLKEKEQAVETR